MAVSGPESDLRLRPAGPLAEDVEARETGPVGALRRWWRGQTTFLLEDVVGTRAQGRRPIALVLPLVSPLLLIPVILVLREPDNTVALIGLLAGGTAIAYGIVAERFERRAENPFWVQLVNAAVYAAFISFLLWAFVVLDHPRPHTHWVVFFLYYLMIGVSGLTDNPRLPVCTGAFSIIGYLAVVPLVEHAAANGSSMAAQVAPQFEWVANAAKVALLAGATVLGTASARRGLAVRRTSLRDGLTGLLNRHAFDDCLQLLARRAERRQLPMTIAMIDIDHFKRLNDTYGHAAGDAVLRWVGSWLMRSFRATDLVARFGGEEFVVGFLDTGTDPLRDRLERLRTGIERTTLRGLDDDEEIQVTISMGVASLPVDGESVDGVLAHADSRLYEAKAAGRNRIVAGPALDAEA